MKNSIALSCLFLFGVVCVDSRAEDNSSVQAKISLRICSEKWAALASGGSKEKRFEAIDRGTLINACQARSFNASMKCHKAFSEGYDKAAEEIKDREKLRERALRELKPELKSCLTTANNSAMKDSERLFGLISAGKKQEANAIADAWINDGSGNVPQ